VDGCSADSGGAVQALQPQAVPRDYAAPVHKRGFWSETAAGASEGCVTALGRSGAFLCASSTPHSRAAAGRGAHATWEGSRGSSASWPLSLPRAVGRGGPGRLSMCSTRCALAPPGAGCRSSAALAVAETTGRSQSTVADARHWALVLWCTRAGPCSTGWLAARLGVRVQAVPRGARVPAVDAALGLPQCSCPKGMIG